MFEAFVILWAQEHLVLRGRWQFFSSGVSPRVLLPRIWLPRILPRIDIWRVRRRRNKDWLPRSCNAKARALTNWHAFDLVAIFLVHGADIISRQINAVRNIVGTQERQDVVEMARIAKAYHFAQFERVHPEHGSSQIITQPHAVESSVVERFIVHQRMRAGQVACDVGSETM